MKFDKKNALAFAEKIYSEETGKYAKLCHGFLDNGKSCIIGEVRNFFLSKEYAKKSFNDLILTLCRAANTDKTEELQKELYDLVHANDSPVVDRFDYLTRAINVKVAWMDKVVPLLKWSDDEV